MELEPHILALLGAATAAAGAGLVVWGAINVAGRGAARTGDSLLAPTLAVDTLDPDLRVAYMRTLVLDARLVARGIGTPSLLGRELRRCLVALQAIRHAGGTHQASIALEDLVAEACDEIEVGEVAAARWDGWLVRARNLRDELAAG